MNEFTRKAMELAENFAVESAPWLSVENPTVKDKVEYDAARAALLTHLEGGEQKPGWKLVPVEPTPEMLQAGYKASMNRLLGDYSNEECNSDEERSAKAYRDDWHAMLAVIPGSPVIGGESKACDHDWVLPVGASQHVCSKCFISMSYTPKSSTAEAQKPTAKTCGKCQEGEPCDFPYCCVQRLPVEAKVQKAETPDWLHLKQYGYAPGNYMNKCHSCGKIGSDLDKRAITCRSCAEAQYGRSLKQLLRSHGPE